MQPTRRGFLKGLFGLPIAVVAAVHAPPTPSELPRMDNPYEWREYGASIKIPDNTPLSGLADQINKVYQENFNRMSKNLVEDIYARYYK